MGVAIWAAFRQIEALRESVAFTLENGAIEKNQKLNSEEFAQWLRDQGVEPVIFTYGDFETDQKIGEKKVHLLISMEEFLKNSYSYAEFFREEKRYSKYNDSDFGAHRSSAGWDSLPNFVITSALVRLLGALEQFELDVLKALLYYRPLGKGQPQDESDVVTVTSEVLIEEPDEEGAYTKPTIWTWIKKSAENNVERRRILNKIYGINATPQEFNRKNKSKDINKYRDELYDKRNAIAHGRANIKMLLSDYCTAEIFVIETIRTISQQCFDKWKVTL